MDIRPHCGYLVRYTLYSGVAVLCEIAVFALFFRHFALPPFWANALSVITGLALAWPLSGRRLFEAKIPFSRHILWYCYQCGAIAAYSYLVARLIEAGTHYLASKVAVLALSFTCNSIFFKAAVLKPRRGSRRD